MWYLKAKDGKLHYLYGKDVFKIGRLNADIKISQITVSRNHAALCIVGQKCFLADLGSTAGTFVDGQKISKDEKVRLRENTELVFGAPDNVYTLHKINLSVACGKLSVDDKTEFERNVEFLQGKLQPKWNEACTHLTLATAKLTESVLCALIANQQMVTVGYWRECVRAVREGAPLPDAAAHRPQLDEVFVSRSLRLDERPGRPTLFEGKHFVFLTEMSRCEMGRLVKMAGGNALSWEAQRPASAALRAAPHRYLFVEESRRALDSQSEVCRSFDQAVGELRAAGRRTIAKTEIIYAIVDCSCERHCNPDFSSRALLVAGDSRSQGTEVVFATETPDVLSEPATPLEVPASFSESASGKRPAEVDGHGTQVAKRLRDSADPLTPADGSSTSSGSHCLQPARNPFVTNRFAKKNSNAFALSEPAQEMDGKKRKADSEMGKEMKMKKAFMEVTNVMQEEGQALQRAELELEECRAALEGTLTSGWLRRDLCSEPAAVNTEPLDEETARWNASFVDCVRVVRRNLLVRAVADECPAAAPAAPRNFKRFRKVPPRHYQSEIISPASFSMHVLQMPMDSAPSSEDEQAPDPDFDMLHARRPAFQFKRSARQPTLSKFFQD